ncbi:MAG TPA: FxSxx-COOH system tetratricopeptide repeat protein [Ktedonobacteraceae bacterium]|nr:FxSxx-COOH system tetratricopeptide repeat protein [Ktedonobacteraceae bacterium]
MTDMMTYPPIWNVPYRRNLFFTGREEILEHIHEALHTSNTACLAQIQGITGLGGIGKTQTALEYAYRYHNDYRAVLWARADAPNTLTAEFVSIAHLLRLPERNEQDQRRVVDAVTRWLRTNSHWLLILDNVEDIAGVEPFLPKAGRGHILLTTRVRALGGVAQRIEIGKMQLEVGALLLLRRAGLLPLAAVLDDALTEDRTLSLQITQEMDGFPLALDQAGAYIREIACTLSTYLALFQVCRTDLLKEQSAESTYPDSVATTWSLSFEKVARQNPAAAELLHLLAFLYPDGIPEEVVTEAAVHMGEVLEPVATEPLLLNGVFRELLRYSLIYRDPDTQTLTIHRLVQAVFHSKMEQNVQLLWAIRAVQAVNEIFPGVEFATWTRCQRYLLQAQKCAELIEEWDLMFANAARLLNQTAAYLRTRGRYDDAEPLYQQALLIWQHELGSTHPYVAACCNNLALVYAEQGNYEQAESFYQLALAIWQQMGNERGNLATGFNNLGRLYLKQGRYEQAEQLFQAALQLREQLLGPLHPDTATVFHNLAELFLIRGQYSEAEQYYQRAHAIREQRLGQHHPETMASLEGLTRLYSHQGKYSLAVPLLEDILATYETVLDPQHPEIATLLNNLASLYEALGKYEQVEKIYLRALAIREQRLGPLHPDVASTLNNLAGHYSSQGKYQQAESLYQRAAAIYEQALGLEHPHTATNLNNLADLYRSQEKYEQAEALYQKAISIFRLVLGNEHPDTVAGLSNLALLYEIQGKYEKAERIMLDVVALEEQTLGLDHPRTAVTLHNLAGLYRIQKRYEQAEQLYERVLAIWKRILEPGHPRIAASLHNLALLYAEQGRYAEAEDLYWQALTILLQTHDITHPDTTILLNNYADLLEKTGRGGTKEALLAQYLILKQQVKEGSTSSLDYRDEPKV